MGTFIDTYGTPSIPKDKLPEFRARSSPLPSRAA